VSEKRLFGTDGVRGRVGEFPITPQDVLKLGWAAGKVLGRGGEKGGGKVLIGKDTRVSGYMLESALEAGLSAAGVDVSLLGPMPTPGIAYLTRSARAQAGIVVSASHNPFEDNGIKFFGPDGGKLPDAVEAEIERLTREPLVTVPSARLGKAERYADARGRYTEFCKSTVPLRMTLDGLRVVLDCANGAAYQIAPDVLRELGASVIALGNRPDGFNINRDCGSTHPEALARAVLAEGADVGVALDGDGDRVILVDEKGRCVDGDQLLYIMMAARAAAGTLGGGVVGTLMSNLGLEQACESAGVSFRRASVGDRHVLAMLQSEGWLLGGESSGHIICLDKSTTGDGIVAALEVLSVMVNRARPLSSLADGMVLYPQTLISVPVNGRAADTDPLVLEAVRSAQAELQTEGRVLLRASGTEPVVRVMVEGRDRVLVERLGAQLAEAVRTASIPR